LLSLPLGLKLLWRNGKEGSKRVAPADIQEVCYARETWPERSAPSRKDKYPEGNAVGLSECRLKLDVKAANGFASPPDHVTEPDVDRFRFGQYFSVVASRPDR
jgi:hypothetical protein